MFNNQKIKSFQLPKKKGVILTIFLLFCVASSKGIIIYNEETLVALSFGLFVFFSSSYFGNTIKESLDERSSTIKNGLENFHRLKEEALQELLFFHKRSLQLKKIFPFLRKDSENQVSYTTLTQLHYQNKQKKNVENERSVQRIKGVPSSSLELYNRFSEQMQQKLSVFQSSKTWLNQRLQSTIAFTIKECVLNSLKNSKQNRNSQSVSKQVKHALKLLSL